ncbi:MAG: (2Fe-2S)-binding protein [Acidithiobacillales bacterium]
MTLRVDGRSVRVPDGATVAAALFTVGVVALRTSVTGEPRGLLCAMGTCFECRVTIDGAPHQRACLTLCRDGMEVTTGG